MSESIKIFNPTVNQILIPEKRMRGKSVVFTNGCFDILHPGHHHLLKSAKNMGDLLVLGLNSDESVRRLKGPSRPVNNQEKRAEQLSKLKEVDFIIIFSEDTPELLIKEIKPDIIVKGTDYKEDEIVGADFVKSYGGKVSTVPLLEGHSTTQIIEKNRKS